MRKQQLTMVFCALLFFEFGCKKISTSDASIQDNSLVKRAQQYFTDSISSIPLLSTDASNLRLSTAKSPAWNEAKVIQLSKYKAVIVPLHYSKQLYMHGSFEGNNLYLLDNIVKLVIFRDSLNQNHAVVLTAFPDSNYVKPDSEIFSGIIFEEDWSGKSINKYKYGQDGSILVYTPGAQDLNSTIVIASSSNRTAPDMISMTICSEIDGYNSSPDDPDNGYSWTESGGCSSYFVADGGGSGGGLSGGDVGGAGGGGGSSNGASKMTPSNVILYGATNPIANIQQYEQCFTNSSAIDHSYTVQICVDQPEAGTRTPWGITPGGPGGSSAAGNLFDVGHTFLILSENSEGSIITRNVGFYPSSAVTPLSPSSQGILNNDAAHEYDISLTITVNNMQFFDILNYVSLGNNTGFVYNLNSNNCTTFAINALASAGISLPITKGFWPLGYGDDPGDFGEDLRNMPLSSDMSRNTVDNSHPNVGSCN
jgi:hypothetical protein